MKDFLKVILMSLIGFFVAVVLYPFLHESGHAIATVILGGECVKFILFPLPYMECNAAGIDNAALVVIGISGMILPFLFSAVMWSKNFYVWYTGLILRGISILSLIISACVILLRWCGIVVANDDITQVLSLWPNGEVWILVGALTLSASMWIIVLKEKPIRRIKNVLV